jgi:hypothetical protein
MAKMIRKETNCEGKQARCQYVSWFQIQLSLLISASFHIVYVKMSDKWQAIQVTQVPRDCRKDDPKKKTQQHYTSPGVSRRGCLSVEPTIRSGW